MDHAPHRRIRQVVAPAFSTQAVTQFRSWTEKLVEDYLSRIENQDEIEFVSSFATPLAVEFACGFMHVPFQDGLELLKKAFDLISILGVSNLTKSERGAADAAAHLYQQYMGDLLDTLKNQSLPPDDFIALLLAAEDKETA
jgi:cytochrome P450